MLDCEEQCAPEFSAGVKAGEIIARKASRLQQRHRQRIPEDEHGRRARGGREFQRARFAGNGGVEVDVCVLREERRRFARDGDGAHVAACEGWEDGHEFIRLAAVAEDEDDIAIAHDAEVAVQRVESVEHHGGRAGACECGRDFLADVPAFTHAHDNDFSTARGGLANRFDRMGKGFVEAFTHGTGFGEFEFKHAPTACDMFGCGLR